MSPEKEQLIPIMLCFNNSYSIPGMVAIHSMLKHASRDYSYNIHILHSDISTRNQNRLMKIVGKFSNAQLFFHNMENRFSDIFEQVIDQAYWSTEIFYKCITPSFFPQYERIVITDADVVFCRDFTPHWELFLKDNESYLAGYTCLIKKHDSFSNAIEIKSPADEAKKNWKVLTAAGFWYQNLKLMRQDNIEARFQEFIRTNLKLLRMPEQEVVNVVCYPRIKLLPPEGMILAWDYVNYRTKNDYNDDRRYTEGEVKYALTHPIQLHYAGSLKPWNAGFVSKSFLWWKELIKTGAIGIILEQLWRFLYGRGYLIPLRIFARNSIAHSRLMRLFYKAYKKCSWTRQ